MDIRESFDRIYVVNLPERTDRRQRMIQQLATIDLSIEADKVVIFPAIRPSETAGFPSIGARGCFLSHLSILKQAEAEGLANVLILEDDLAIAPQFKFHQAGLLQQLQETEWDFAYFGHRVPVPDSNPAIFQPFVGEMITTHFYAVNGRILKRLVHYLEAVHQRSPGEPGVGPMHVDGAYNHFRWDNPDVVNLVSSPSLGEQAQSRSDVHPNWYDQVHGVKALVEFARRLNGLII